MDSDLTQDELLRYSRHLTLPEVGMSGQLRLKHSKVLCIGAGGLGSPVLMYLAAAGVGQIGLVEFDEVELTNLQRQIIHGQSDIGRPKGMSAQESIKEINPHCQVQWYNQSVNKDNILPLLQDYDLVIDGTDNFPTRYLVNDACVLAKKPNIYGSIFRFEGQVSVFAPELGGPCYRCLFPEPPPPGSVPNCAEGGVLGVLPGIIGSLQANEALKWILGKGDLLINRLWVFDALKGDFRTLKVRRDPSCPVCGDHPTQTELIEYSGYCSLPHHEKQESSDEDAISISVHDLKKKWDDHNTTVVLLDVREPFEIDICQINGSLKIPLGHLKEKLSELDPKKEYYVHCKSGKRSIEAVKILRDAGFETSYSVSGGILAWADEFDSSMMRY